MDRFKYGNKKLLALTSLTLFFSASFGGIALYSMRFLTDYAMEGNLNALLKISKALVFVIIIELGINLILARIKAYYLEISTRELKQFYIHELFNLDILNFSTDKNNVFLSQLSNDSDRYEQKFFMNLIDLISASTQLLVSLIILATFHISLFMLALMLFGLFIVVANKTSKPVEAHEQKKSQSLQNYTHFVEESLDGFLEVKQNQLETERRNLFKKFSKKVQNDNYTLDKKTSQIDAMNGFIQMFVLFSLVSGGLLAAKALNLSLGTTLVAGVAFANSIWPMQRVTPLISEMRGASVILKDFNKTLHSSIEDGNRSIEEIKNLEFKDVSLAYGEQTILEKVNLEVHKGEKILIVGESGAGKSTLLKGIRRQIQIKTGSITSNFHPIKEYLAQDYFSEISIVDQIGFIFNGTVLENITLYDEYNYDHLKNLIKQVGLRDISLDDKLKNNGSNLSGGQRTRILLARALFKEKSLIICDEIFASLDTDIASKIEKDILSIKPTLINVSHIFFEENIDLYDKIYLVENNTIQQIDSKRVLQQKL